LLGADNHEEAMTVPKNTVCLWYDKDAEAAANFYAQTVS
jgi:predicted 3-demethylubiquinone-9 3-methyltransferase (glyoxalase superfamily)